MRRRAARIAALGLSTIALMSTVVFPIRVQAAEVDGSGSLVDVPEEKVAVESVMPSYEQQLADGADAVVSPMLEELPTEIEGEELTDAADGIAAAEDAIENIKGIPGAIRSMEDALETYGEASEEYEEANYEFTDYKNNALMDIWDAQDAFNAVQSQLDEMESDAQAKKEELGQDADGYAKELAELDVLLSQIQTAKRAYYDALDLLDELEWEVMSIQPITIGHGSGPIIFDPGVKPEPNPDPEIIPEPIVNEQPLPIVSAVKDTVEDIIYRPVAARAAATEAVQEEVAEKQVAEEQILEEEIPAEEAPVISEQSSTSGSASSSGDTSEEVQPQPKPVEPEAPQVVTIQEEETPKGVTLAGIMERGKWFIALGGVSVAGAGVGVLEAKRRAAMKILDKLNQ